MWAQPLSRRSADPQAHIETVAPNLEDVFVAATRGRGRERAA